MVNSNVKMRSSSSHIILVLVVMVSMVHISSGLSQSACFSPQNATIDLDCGEGHMVHITKTFYGYSPSRHCRLVEEESREVGGAGCHVVEQNVHYGCVGQRTCQVNLPRGDWGITIPGCGQRSNYFQVEYTCVPAASVSNICTTSRLTAPSGYLSTPNYPANYHHPGRCVTTIHAHPDQKLTLHIIDMELQSTPGAVDCEDYLYFNDKLRSITVCGSRSNNTYRMHSNFLHIELMSTSGGKSKGFWIYYEADPPLPTSMLAPTPEDVPAMKDAPQVEDDPQLVAHSNPVPASTARPWHPRSTVPLIRNTPRSHSDPLPFAAIAGGVIGTLSLILVVLLLLLLVKWLKERRYNKVEKCLEIRNPAFRSSADFYEAQPGGSPYPKQLGASFPKQIEKPYPQQAGSYYPNNSNYC